MKRHPMMMKLIRENGHPTKASYRISEISGNLFFDPNQTQAALCIFHQS